MLSFETGNVNYQAKVTGRARRGTRKYKSSYNMEYLSPDNLIGHKSWIYLSKVDISAENETKSKTGTTKIDEILRDKLLIMQRKKNSKNGKITLLLK